MNIVEKIPLPVCGLILALLSLGNLLQDVNPYFKGVFGVIGIVFLVLVVLKVVFYPGCVKRDFENPIIVSSCGTFSMSVMIISTYIMPFTSDIAYIIWIIGIVLHILLIIYFTYHFIIRDFNITAVYPSYWIVFVGITMAAITSKNHNITEIGNMFFLIGFTSMLITTPLIIYRYIKYPEIPDMNKPLICIFTALYSILIVGYLNSAQTISAEFSLGMYILSCIFYIFSLYKFISYRKLEFYPSFAAFTFPFVISTTATKEIITHIPINIPLNILLNTQLIIATLLVCYVLVRYLKFLKKTV
ncbi:MAG: TDT family transporter [Methanobrevibacter thaueri]|nr:TDT family transporter [Methanobrevibacter thaueri]